MYICKITIGTKDLSNVLKIYKKNKLTKKLKKMKKTFKKFIFGMMCLGALVAISAFVSCDKDEDKPASGGGGVTPAEEYVDLGLPSGTKWKTTNEVNTEDSEYDFFTYSEAKETFGTSQLPTKEQLEELVNSCTWTWKGNGSEVKGPNGKTIFLPAAGFDEFDAPVTNVGTWGYLWSSTPDETNTQAWMLYFNESTQAVGKEAMYQGYSVRLVK